MGKNTSVSLGDHFTTFIESCVDEGRYGSASDVLRAGTAPPGATGSAGLAGLRAALIEGEQSGAATPFDFEEFIARKRATDSRQ